MDKDLKAKNSDDLDLILLKTAGNDYELNTITSILDENNIPYLVKEKGIGGYMRIISGSSLYGADILVEKSMYEKAKSIIDEFPWDMGQEE
ncbi:MAG: DUF2007 domain-containing protein [Tissierellia bacterium]|nr:DUF2007 domain-containing protein [Tissierellia bacterium]